MQKQPISVIAVNGNECRELGQVSGRLREVQGKISGRAYEIFEAGGRSFGHELDHWFRAESEILQATPVAFHDSEAAFTVRAEVPGFKADEIEVMVEPWRLTIVGNRENKSKPEAGKTVHSGQDTVWILRVIEFPGQVDTGGVTARLKDSALEMTLPKAVAERAAKVKSNAA